jgi:hypothetical protein
LREDPSREQSLIDPAINRGPFSRSFLIRPFPGRLRFNYARKAENSSAPFPLAFRASVCDSVGVRPMISVYRASFTVLCVLAGAHAVVPALLEHSVSTSRQFLVYGTDVRLRGAICDLAERTKHDVLQLIDQRDEWTTPIVVNAQYPQANLPETPRAALNFAQTGFGLKLQLDLTIDLDVSQPEVRRELLRAILLEMMYRRETDLPAGTAYVPPPAWLLDGIPPRQSDFDQGKFIDVLGVPVTARKIPPLAEFLRLRNRSGLDAPGRSLSCAYSFALVELLTHTPDGRGRLARFIANLPSASNDPMADLGVHFPELRSASAAEKVWSLRIEQLATGQLFQLLTVEETEQKLDELLVLEISAAGPAKKYHLNDFQQFIRNASSKLVLARFSRDLSILATRANPIYRPMIYEYARIGTLLARGKTNGIVERLVRLSASRKGIAAQVREINDYMNWFEATKSRGPSGAFTDYLKAAELASEPEQRRRDPISVYLDVLEMQFQN